MIHSYCTSAIYGAIGGFLIGVLSYYCLFRRRGRINHENEGKRSKLVMVVRTDLDLQKGKVASLCSQAALECYKKAMVSCPSLIKTWEYHGQAKVVLKLPSAEGSLIEIQKTAEKAGIVTFLIKEENNAVILALGPSVEDILDKVTGHIRLL